MSVSWYPEPLDQKLARDLRRDVRARRREKGRGGHRFFYRDLRELWSGREGEDIRFAVLSHHEDPLWQVWAMHLEKGWLLVDWFESRDEACAVAEEFHWPEDVPAPDEKHDEGLFVLAGWPKQGEPTTFTMKTYCRTKNAAIAVAESYAKLGCETKREEIQ